MSLDSEGPNVSVTESKNLESPKIDSGHTTSFTRTFIDDGQLSVVNNSPDALSVDQVNALIRTKPWTNPGKPLDVRRRRIELLHLPDNKDVVLKEFEYSGVRVAEEHQRDVTLSNSPSAQVAIVDEAKNRFMKKYGEELPVEELLGFFIAKDSKKYMFYKYYPTVDSDYTTARGRSLQIKAFEQMEDYRKKCNEIGVYIGESGNYLQTLDATNPDSFKLRLIDTEYWRIDASYKNYVSEDKSGENGNK